MTVYPFLNFCLLTIITSSLAYGQVSQNAVFNPDTVAVSLADQQQQVWLGNAQGLYKIKGKTVTRFTTQNGLSDQQITALAEGTPGEIWIGTPTGVNRYKKGEFSHFSFKNGLINKNVRAFHQDKQGRLWVLHHKGAQYFDRSNQTFRLVKQLADVDIRAAFEHPGNLVFLSNQSRIYLPYHTPFQQTLWFRGLLAFLVILLAVGGVLYYNRTSQKQLHLAKKQAQSEQKALLAQMNPHFIFNALNSIQRFIAQNNVEQASIYLSRFSNLLRITLENSRKGYVSLEDELRNLELYLRLEFLRFENRFTYAIDNQADWYNQSEMPTMLLQPFVENAIWHGLMNKDTNDGYIKITVYSDDDYLYFSIKDNGVGREKAAQIKAQKKTQHQSRGLEIIRERIGLLNQKNELPVTLAIQDLNAQEGTEVKIKIPMNE